jgi:hypothetical protein
MILGAIHKKWFRSGDRYSVYFQERKNGLFAVWPIKNGKDMIQIDKCSPRLLTLGKTVEEAFKKMLQKLPFECWPIEEIGKNK